MTTAAPTKTAAAALIRDQPRLRRVSTKGAKVAAMMAATRIDAVTTAEQVRDPEQDEPECDRGQQPPADGGETLQPSRDEPGALRRRRRDLGHVPSLLDGPSTTASGVYPTMERLLDGFALSLPVSAV